jgi:RNA polymerase sigma-70 factor, ECF subfamily
MTALPDAPGPADDASVVERVLNGDTAAYATLVGRYQASSLHYALAMVGDGDVAADVVQDAFIKAYRTLSDCRDPGRFGSWFFRIVRNRCLDHLKGRRVRTRWAASEEGREVGRPDAAMERFELRGALGRALSQLTPEQRDAFLMKHLYERSYEEMAEETGVSVSALKMRVSRAREVLQQEMTADTWM